jgi:hypothetical protein
LVGATKVKRDLKIPLNALLKVLSVLALTFASICVSSLGNSAAASTESGDVASVQLRSTAGTNGQRTYIADLRDSAGSPVTSATLDIGGLGTDPDLRITTTPMKLFPADQSFRATVNVPANGDWVLVVRVHKPSTMVELFTERIEGITGLGVEGSGHSGSGSYSQKGLLTADPTFFDRYQGMGSAPATAGADSSLVAKRHTDAYNVRNLAEGARETDTQLNMIGVAASTFHSLAALVWITAILGLMLAGKVGSSSLRSELVNIISSKYHLLAGGGLLVVGITGVMNIEHNSPGLLQPTELVQTNLGMAYLAVFGFKIALFIASLITTLQIGKLIRGTLQNSGTLFSPQGGAIGAGVTFTTRIYAIQVEAQSRVFHLARTNALLAGAIVIAVTVLNQLHRLIH